MSITADSCSNSGSECVRNKVVCPCSSFNQQSTIGHRKQSKSGTDRLEPLTKAWRKALG